MLDRPQYAQFREYVQTLLELNEDLVARTSRGEHEEGEAVMALQAIADGAIKKYKMACAARTVIEWMKFTYSDLSKTTLAGNHG